MNLLIRFISAIVQWRKLWQRKRLVQPRQSRFCLEALEPRVLLSADLVPHPALILPPQPQASIRSTAMVEPSTSNPRPTINWESGEQKAIDGGTTGDEPVHSKAADNGLKNSA